MHFGIDSYSVADSEFVGSDGPMFHSRSQVRNWLSETETVIEEPVLPYNSDNSATDDPQSKENDLPGSFPAEVPSSTNYAYPSVIPAIRNFCDSWGRSPSITPQPDPVLDDGSIYEVESMQQPAPEFTMPALHTLLSSIKPIRPMANQGLSNQYQNSLTKPLRKTIVSRAALERLHIEYKEVEHSKTVFIDKELEASAIVEARKLSVQLCKLS